MCGCILSVYESAELRKILSKNAIESAKKYDLKEIRKKMAEIYDEANVNDSTRRGIAAFDFVTPAAATFAAFSCGRAA